MMVPSGFCEIAGCPPRCLQSLHMNADLSRLLNHPPSSTRHVSQAPGGLGLGHLAFPQLNYFSVIVSSVGPAK